MGASKNKQVDKTAALREPTEARRELYEVMRAKFPGGKKESQMKMSLELSDDRVPYYIDLFKLYPTKSGKNK